MKQPKQLSAQNRAIQELLQREPNATDPLETGIIRVLLDITENMSNGQDPIPMDPGQVLRALLALSTPTVGTEYKGVIANIYFASNFNNEDPASPAETASPQQQMVHRTITCLSKAQEHAQQLHQTINKHYTQDLLEVTTDLMERAQTYPWSVIPKIEQAVNIADTAYLVSSHPDQPGHIQEASEHAGQARANLILTQTLMQAFNRTMGNTAVTANGHPTPAALHGKYLYHHFIREQVQDLRQHYVVIDVKTADFETSKVEAEAHVALRQRRPEALCWVERTGSYKQSYPPAKPEPHSEQRAAIG